MTAWVVRSGRYGEREPEALDNGFLSIGWANLADLSAVSGRKGFTEMLANLPAGLSLRQIGNYSSQIRSFVEEIQPGDLAIMPRKGTGLMAVGVFEGGYLYRSDQGESAHGRRVRWLDTQVSRDLLEDDLKNSLSANSTIFRPRARQAEERLRALAEGRSDGPESVSGLSPSAGDDSAEDELPLNVEEYAREQIRAHVERNFHGHALSRLVAAVLEAEGFGVKVSPPGPDGGVDILAGKGPMGFDSPRICVQVKSGSQISGVSVLRELQGVMQTFQADHGLLVSWGGFARPAEQEARAMHFNIRLWSSDDLLETVFENYDLLPADVRTELPLKRMWALVQEDAE